MLELNEVIREVPQTSDDSMFFAYQRGSSVDTTVKTGVESRR